MSLLGYSTCQHCLFLVLALDFSKCQCCIALDVNVLLVEMSDHDLSFHSSLLTTKALVFGTHFSMNDTALNVVLQSAWLESYNQLW